MKRKFKHYWSTFHQKQQTPLTSNHIVSKKTKTYDVRNPGPGLEQAQKCGRIKPGSGIPIPPPPFLNIGS